MSNYPYKSDDPDCPTYQRCPTCDTPAAVIEFEPDENGIIRCNRCRIETPQENDDEP